MIGRIRTLFSMLFHVPRIILNREVDLLCGYLCYTTLLSLVPLIVVMVIVGRWMGAHDKDTFLLARHLLELLTPESAAQVKSAFADLYQNARVKRLGLTALVPILLFLFMKIRMLRASFVALLGHSRTFPWFLDLALLVALLASFPLVFSVFNSLVLKQIPKQELFYAFNLRSMTLMVLAFGFLMRLFLPPGISLWRQLSGAVLGALVLTLGNRFFSHLTTHVFQMNRLYGAFAFIPLFMVWVYFFWMTLITCLVLCSNRWRQLSAFHADT